MMSTLEQLDLYLRSRCSLIALRTHEEGRAQRLLERLARDREAPLWTWSCSEGLRHDQVQLKASSTSLTRALELLRSNEETRALFVFKDLQPWLQDPQVIRQLRDLVPQMASRQQALIALGPALSIPYDLEKDMLTLDLPLPSAGEVERILQFLLNRKGLKLEPERMERFVSAALGMTEQELKRAFAMILVGGKRFDESDLQTIARLKCQAIAATPGLELSTDEVKLSSVGGLGNLKLWMQRRAMGFSSEARSFGLPTPKGVFLLGVQGCGKSLMAKAVAGYLEQPLLRLDVGVVFQTGDGGSESLRQAIQLAESIAPVVLWIDELEKGFMAAKEQGGGRAFGNFLTWMQEKSAPVFVIATANEVRALPPELLRKGRFDEIFFVDLPDVHERLQVLSIHLTRRGRSPDDYDLLQCAEESEKYSGAELEQIIVESLFDAYARGDELRDRDLLRTIRETVPLAVTMDDRLKELREWARPRTRPATLNRRRLDFFEDFFDSTAEGEQR